MIEVVQRGGGDPAVFDVVVGDGAAVAEVRERDELRTKGNRREADERKNTADAVAADGDERAPAVRRTRMRLE